MGAQEQWKCTPGNSTDIFALTKRLLSHLNKYMSPFPTVATARHSAENQTLLAEENEIVFGQFGVKQ